VDKASVEGVVKKQKINYQIEVVKYLSKFRNLFRLLKIFSLFVALLATLTPIQAIAYIGPGLGLGVAAMVLGLFVAFILLIIGLIWLPIRRILRQRKEKQETQSYTPSSKH